MTSMLEVFIIGFLASGVRLSVPILLSAIGELYSEKSGVLNLGVEGIMLVGAASSFIAAYATGNLWIGLVVGMIAGCVAGLIMAYASVTLSANQVLTGLAILFLGTGLSTVLIWLAGIQNLARINTFEVIPIPI